MQVRTMRRRSTRTTLRELEQRVEDLEADLAEARRHNVRLAELADVVAELLVPISSRDEAAVEEAIERFRSSL